MAHETILVVEDETLVGEELKEDLERLGYQVPDIIPTGESVSDAVALHHPALILMDIRIGGSIDGIQAAAALKETSDIPIIYLTAYSDPDTLARAAATEPCAYLLKPFSERELQANVSMALAKRRNPEPSAVVPDPILDTLSLPAFLLDPSGAIEYANAPALTLLGISSILRIRGKPMSRFLLEQRPNEARRVLLLSNGEERKVVVRIDQLRTPSGKARGTLIVIDQMSHEERRNLEVSAGVAAAAMLSLLPASDASGPGYQTAGFLLASPSGSGDLYDVFPLDDDHFAFYELDVMGHGVLQSLFAFSLHDVIRLIATTRTEDSLPDPAQIARALNDRYSGGSDLAPFFSMVYGIVERSTGKFRFVRAGHPPIIHVPAVGTAHAISEHGGSALGAFTGISFVNVSGTMNPGDRLVLCSDGLFEGISGEVGKGLSDFLRVVEIGRALESRVFASSVRASIIARAAQRSERLRIQDDASMLVIERLPNEF